MVRREAGAFSQATGRALDLHNNRMVRQMVEQRRGDYAVAEHVPNSPKLRMGVEMIAQRA